MNTEKILEWLRENDENRLSELWLMADEIRQKYVGDEVHLRGLLEISNHCSRSCAYCGIRAPSKIARYRMSREEILEGARLATRLGYGTVVLQAGEDPGLDRDFIADIVSSIIDETGLAVTLSLGERSLEELTAWRNAGADRYLMRFETSNTKLYRKIHPPLKKESPDRLEILKWIRELGYETGSGIMIGIPGQTYTDLAADIELFRSLDLDMIGIGPFIPHPDTPLGKKDRLSEKAADQVPSSELMTLKALALTRILCPYSNIPSTTALSTINPEEGRELGLSRGANIVMPNLTPVRYRRMYEIYPDKACIGESPEDCAGCLNNRIRNIGRKAGRGRGDSPNIQRRKVK